VAGKPPLPHNEVQRILRRLEPLMTERRVILVGGQAVSFWMRMFQPHSDELASMEPLTSKDIDFEGSAQSVRRVGELLDGRVKVATMDDHTPNTGLVIFTDSGGFEREIDFIEAPLGLNARDVRDTAVQLMVPDESGAPAIPIWVMHPERCMESRVINTIALNKTQPLALRQLRVSITCAQLWSRYILDRHTDLSEDKRVRAVLNINERIFRKCMTDKRFRDVSLDHGADPFAAVLVDHALLPDRFRERRYPQIQAQLIDRLRRDRRNRARRDRHARVTRE
jgi:hypothetical protein